VPEPPTLLRTELHWKLTFNDALTERYAKIRGLTGSKTGERLCVCMCMLTFAGCARPGYRAGLHLQATRFNAARGTLHPCLPKPRATLWILARRRAQQRAWVQQVP